jgi:hypothetical protein
MIMMIRAPPIDRKRVDKHHSNIKKKKKYIKSNIALTLNFCTANTFYVKNNLIP